MIILQQIQSIFSGFYDKFVTDNTDHIMIMKNLIKSMLVMVAMVATVGAYGQKTSGNPIFEGRYADPEGVIFGKTYWIYPTWSMPFKDQLHLDAFSSKDLVNWTKHERIIDNSRIKWLRNALWAPAAIEKDGKYYIFFSCNNILMRIAKIICRAYIFYLLASLCTAKHQEFLWWLLITFPILAINNGVSMMYAKLQHCN